MMSQKDNFSVKCLQFDVCNWLYSYRHLFKKIPKIVQESLNLVYYAKFIHEDSSSD